MSELKYWNNGEPVITQSDLGGLKHWKDGEPYVVYGAAGAAQTEADAIMFGMNM